MGGENSKTLAAGRYTAVASCGQGCVVVQLISIA